jgi:hypothetical protein
MLLNRLGSWKPASARPLLIDAAFITSLLVLACIPLIALRGSRWWHVAPVVWGYWAGGAVVTILWEVVQRRLSHRAVDGRDAEPRWGVTRTAAGERGRAAIEATLLLALTLVTFADPMRRHFWGGFDEPSSSLRRAVAMLWSDDWDEKLARPLLGVPAWLGQTVTPDRVEGFLGMAVALCFLNGLLLMAIIRRVLPGGTLVGVAAAALLIANRAEPLRFFPLWTTNFYWMALFWALLGLWLLLLSHDRRSRGLLAASCVALGAALLTSEGLYPLALLGPLLLWLQGARGPRLLSWSYAWFGTLTLLAARFGTFLWQVGSDSYQLGQLGTTWEASRALSTLRTLVSPLLTYLQPSGAVREYRGSSLLALVIVVAVLGLAVRPLERPAPRRGYVLGLGIAALAILLGVVLFMPVAGLWRTQYFAGPGQAALVAIALGLLGSLLPGRPGQWLVVATTGILVANATAASLRSQDSAAAPIRFEKTVHIFRQIHGLSPRLAADTLVLLVLDNGNVSPLGVNYHVCDLSWVVLEALAVQANYADPHGNGPRFGPEVVAIQCRDQHAYAYERIVAFRLSVDGTVSLLSRLPSALAPWDHVSGKYQPLSRLIPGPIDQLPYLRYPSWSERLLDVLDTEGGVLLGANWSGLEHAEAALFRWADRDAEIVVNPIGRDRRELALDAEPAGDLTGRPGDLRVLDETGRVVASAPLKGGRQPVRMTLPLDPGRVAVFRLRVEPRDPTVSGDPGGRYLRVWRSDGETRARHRPAERTADIVGDDRRLRLGQNWYPFERFAGETFRWFDNDAEIVVDRLPHGPVTLELDLAPGPGLGGQPCRLTVLDRSGQALARATVGERAAVRLPLTITSQPEATFRLHVEGGGQPTPGDPRILNCRVFSIRRLDVVTATRALSTSPAGPTGRSPGDGRGRD